MLAFLLVGVNIMDGSKKNTASALLVDALELRRMQTSVWLSDWVDENNLNLISMTPSKANEILDVSDDFKLVIFSVGGLSLGTSEFMRPMRILHALCPGTPFVILSDLEEIEEMSTAIEKGAIGYLPSTLDPKLALRALTFILNGGSYFPPSALKNLYEQDSPTTGSEKTIQTLSSHEDHRLSVMTQDVKRDGEVDELDHDKQGKVEEAASCDLTHRQNEVLYCLREGQPNKVIAHKLGMSEATVKVHVRDLMRKLGVQNRTQAALWQPEEVQYQMVSGDR